MSTKFISGESTAAGLKELVDEEGRAQTATLETFNWLKTIPGESIAEGLKELVEGGRVQPSAPV